MLNIKKFTQSAALGLFIAGAVGASPAFANLSHHAHTLNGRDIVAYNGDAAPGSIVIHVNERRLYYVVGDGSAISYPVAVPKSGKEWSGVTSISSKQENPDWSPPADVRADHPELPEVIPGGAPNNPMGTRAMLLEKGEVAIHGTTNKMRASIGSAASYGCIRMLNEDVADLYNRVGVGATVVVEP